MTRVDIAPGDIMPVVAGALPLLPDVVASCEGMAIARRVGQGALEVACAHPRHGVHPRYSALATAISAMRYGQPVAGVCPICGDAEWLASDAAAARQQVTLAWAVGYYRGVPLPERQPKPRPRRAPETQDAEEVPNVADR